MIKLTNSDGDLVYIAINHISSMVREGEVTVIYMPAFTHSVLETPETILKMLDR